MTVVPGWHSHREVSGGCVLRRIAAVARDIHEQQHPPSDERRVYLSTPQRQEDMAAIGSAASTRRGMKARQEGPMSRRDGEQLPRHQSLR